MRLNVSKKYLSSFQKSLWNFLHCTFVAYMFLLMFTFPHAIAVSVLSTRRSRRICKDISCGRLDQAHNLQNIGRQALVLCCIFSCIHIELRRKRLLRASKQGLVHWIVVLYERKRMPNYVWQVRTTVIG